MKKMLSTVAALAAFAVAASAFAEPIETASSYDSFPVTVDVDPIMALRVDPGATPVALNIAYSWVDGEEGGFIPALIGDTTFDVTLSYINNKNGPTHPTVEYNGAPLGQFAPSRIEVSAGILDFEGDGDSLVSAWGLYSGLEFTISSQPGACNDNLALGWHINPLDTIVAAPNLFRGSQGALQARHQNHTGTPNPDWTATVLKLNGQPIPFLGTPGVVGNSVRGVLCSGTTVEMGAQINLDELATGPEGSGHYDNGDPDNEIANTSRNIIFGETYDDGTVITVLFSFVEDYDEVYYHSDLP